MRNEIYKHNSADSIISTTIITELQNIITEINSPIRKNGAPFIRAEIIDGLHRFGWSEAVKLDSSSNISITSAKEKIGICVQFGNISRIYADLVKLQTLFLRGSINAGIMILPSKDIAIEMGENMANSNRLINELNIFKEVFTIPLLIVGLHK